MEIFTKELLIQFVESVANTFYSLACSILSSLWQNAAGFFPSMFAAVDSHDWVSLTIYIILLLVIVGLVYKLIRRQVQG